MSITNPHDPRAAELQRLDEMLTAQGHDTECQAYEPGEACSCGVGGVVMGIARGASERAQTQFMAPGKLVLTGAKATALAEYEAAARAYEAAQEALKGPELAWRQALARLNEALLKG